MLPWAPAPPAGAKPPARPHRRPSWCRDAPPSARLPWPCRGLRVSSGNHCILCLSFCISRRRLRPLQKNERTRRARRPLREPLPAAHPRGVSDRVGEEQQGRPPSSSPSGRVPLPAPEGRKVGTASQSPHPARPGLCPGKTPVPHSKPGSFQVRLRESRGDFLPTEMRPAPFCL